MKTAQFRLMVEDLCRELKGISEQSGYRALHNFPLQHSKFVSILGQANGFVESINFFLESVLKEAESVQVNRASDVCDYILRMIEIENEFERDAESGSIFSSAEDKMKEALLSFKSGDFSGTIGSLNTCLEIALKDKLKIPTTVKQINTLNLLEICAKHKIWQPEFLAQAKKHVLDIDNEIKHRALKAEKKDAILALKSMEDLMGEMKKADVAVADEVREKIYSLLEERK